LQGGNSSTEGAGAGADPGKRNGESAGAMVGAKVEEEEEGACTGEENPGGFTVPEGRRVGEELKGEGATTTATAECILQTKMAATPQKRKLSKTPATTTAMISDDTASAALRLISNYCTNSGLLSGPVSWLWGKAFQS